MLALENPHCGVSGVPFMNRTTGAEATALSIAERISLESSRICVDVRKRGAEAGMGRAARVAARKACAMLNTLHSRNWMRAGLPKEMPFSRTFWSWGVCGFSGLTAGCQSTSAFRRKFNVRMRSGNEIAKPL